MIEIHKRSAAFVRGFFAFLESRKIQAAVLHGGADGFERDLSDVDFVVDQAAFTDLPALIDEYCAHAGWRLCQVLRHETTAAYFVCSAADDPACAVALDACSDYQRNGTLFLTAEEILKSRQPLSWGGHGLSPATELRYRFAKAAAKHKNLTQAAEEFARYPAEDRRVCAAWLAEHWEIHPGSWDADSLTNAFAKLRKKSNRRPSLTQAGALKRIISRICRPAGLIVIIGRDDFDANAARLESVFGHLYFRRFKKGQRWQPTMLKDLVASTLIVLPELGAFWRQILPTDCLYRMVPGDNCQFIAKHLHQRCKHRETR